MGNRNSGPERLIYWIRGPDGTEHRGHNLAAFCRENNLDRGNMHKVIDGMRKQHKGYTCPTHERNVISKKA